MHEWQTKQSIIADTNCHRYVMYPYAMSHVLNFIYWVNLWLAKFTTGRIHKQSDSLCSEENDRIKW